MIENSHENLWLPHLVCCLPRNSSSLPSLMRFARRSTLLTLSTVLLCSAIPLAAQRLGPAPKRPKTSAVADTNDARAYHDFAMDVFEKEPDASAAAFYWAARMDPGLASALYGRRAALILRNKSVLTTYMAGGRKRYESKEIRALDSLYLRALMINPFLYTQLDKRMFLSYIRAKVIEESRVGGSGEVSPSELSYFIDVWLRNSDAETRAWIAYNDGSFPKALQLYADAIKSAKDKDKADLRVSRARVFALNGRADSALTEFRLAVQDLRKRDAKDLVVLYNSKAVLEHSIGMLLEQVDSVPAAREAYGRALQEDLSYYPAHLRLGLIAAGLRDSTTALSELDLAAQIATDEPTVHLTYAQALAQFGRFPESVIELNKAVALEPIFAKPYVLLAALLEAKGDKTAALAAYNQFLILAKQNDGDRPGMTTRRALLIKAMGAELEPS